MTKAYPANSTDRDLWIVRQRPPRESLNLLRPYAFFVEEECSPSGEIVPVATIFLTNRECPWRCVMCDLWRNTLPSSVPPGAIPAQIDYALTRLPVARAVKLYNSGSFFDPGAIPAGDYPEIASRLVAFDRVTVESHPALVGSNTIKFQTMIDGKLEVAMGLETAHPQVLKLLNKRMTLEQFSVAATFLKSNDIDLRTFILLQPPFMKPEDSLVWAQRSIEFAFDNGATAATIIPTRANNGAMESLKATGDWTAPTLEQLESAVCYGIATRRGRVFADLWEVALLPSCLACAAARIDRLQAMNLCQQILQQVSCHACGVRG